ncbi:hypothetical protein BJ170DRAFT_607942 [Xylariales sp. AK1849]|nr:hypothetical protein BJ170DRAFT_607942 [Xylariales sp. AK1849]
MDNPTALPEQDDQQESYQYPYHSASEQEQSAMSPPISHASQGPSPLKPSPTTSCGFDYGTQGPKMPSPGNSPTITYSADYFVQHPLIMQSPGQLPDANYGANFDVNYGGADISTNRLNPGLHAAFTVLPACLSYSQNHGNLVSFVENPARMQYGQHHDTQEAIIDSFARTSYDQNYGNPTFFDEAPGRTGFDRSYGPEAAVVDLLADTGRVQNYGTPAAFVQPPAFESFSGHHHAQLHSHRLPRMSQSQLGSGDQGESFCLNQGPRPPLRHQAEAESLPVSFCVCLHH